MPPILRPPIHRTSFQAGRSARAALGSLVCLAWLCGGPTPARAASLHSATLTVEIGSFTPLVFPAAGAIGSATSPSSVLLSMGPAFTGTAIGIASPPLGLVDAVRLSLLTNGPGVFQGTPVGGNAAFVGFVQLRTKTLGAVPVSLTLVLGNPFSLSGQIGTLPTIGVPIFGTFTAFPWRTDTVAIPTPSGSATRQGANALSALGAGSISFVTPLMVRTSLTGPDLVPTFARLDLVFVPEPGTALLLLWGSLCLAVAGRRRARARS